MRTRLKSLLARSGAALLGLLGLLGSAGCAPPQVMCTSSVACSAKANCAAGRCVAGGGTPSINTARRLVFAPRDMAYVRRGGEAGPAGSTPAVGRLGRGDGAMVLLRFEAPLPPQANVLEAYVVLEREGGAEDDPSSVALHAARIADPWNGADVSWAHQPRVVDVGAPTTQVIPSSLGLVRLDVHDLVSHWRLRGREDFGIAILAEGPSETSEGVGFALLPTLSTEPERGRSTPLLTAAGRDREPDDADWEELLPSSEPGVGRSPPFVQAGPRGPTGPVLELYVKLM